MTIHLPTRRLSILLYLLVASVVAAGLFSLTLRFALGLPDTVRLVTLFDLNSEGNLPTWVSSLLLACASVLLALAALSVLHVGARRVVDWGLLALLFALLSLDEATGLHESLGLWLSETYGPFGGIAFYVWVLPATVFVGSLGTLYAGLLASLPVDIRTRFLFAATLYVGSALGVEALGGWWAWSYGEGGFGYMVLTVVEESGELLGLAVFIDALLRHLAAGGVAFAFAAPRRSTAP